MVQDKGKLVHSHPANELTEKQFGFESVIVKSKIADATAITLVIDSDAVPTGKIWKITHITIVNYEGDIATRALIYVNHDGADFHIKQKVSSTAQYETVNVHTEIYLDAEDFVRAYFSGVTSGEECRLYIFGYEMNAP